MGTGVRKAKLISIDELKKAISYRTDTSIGSYYGEIKVNFYKLRQNCSKLDKDLNKIKFDFQNSSTNRSWKKENRGTSLFDFNTIDGLTFLGCYAGGDWELPVFFIIYMDQNNKLRGYIPKDGNCYNQLMNSAFGNNAYADEENNNKTDSIVIKKQYGLDVSEEDTEGGDIDIDYDFEKMKIDIMNHISVEGYIAPIIIPADELPPRKIIILGD